MKYTPAPYSQCQNINEQLLASVVDKNYVDIMNSHNLEYSLSECVIACISPCQKIGSCGSSDYYKCQKSCPPSCELEYYSYTSGSLNFPPKNYFKLNENFTDEFRSNYSFAELKQSVLKLTLRYEDLSYTIIEQKPKFTFDSLIGTFGGTIGCFLGASLLSIAELLQLLLDIILLIFIRSDTQIGA